MLILDPCLDVIWERVRYIGILLSVMVLSESVVCRAIISNFGDVHSISGAVIGV